MEATRIKRAFANAKFHLRVMWRGFCRTIYGASVAGLIAMAVYGFISVTAETGWVAVLTFVGSCAVLMIALMYMYSIGHGKSGGARHE